MQKKMVRASIDYDTIALCHPGKANVVADDLSRVSMGSMTRVSFRRKI